MGADEVFYWGGVYDIIVPVKSIFLGVLLLTAAFRAAADGFSEEDAGYRFPYVGAAGGALMPGHGNSLKRAAEVTVRGGYFFNEAWALEGELFCAPSSVCHGGNTTVSGGAVKGLWRLAGWEAFDKLFGCERFDPFLTGGAAARFAGRHVFADDSHRTAIGPVFGFGAFYHLTDRWDLRADVTAQLCCDTPCGMVYAASIGLQYSFGDGE